MQDKSQHLPPELARAVELHQGSQKAYVALIEWLAIGEPPNQKMVVGLLRHLMSLSPALSQPHSLVFVSAYSYLLRRGVREQWPAEWELGLTKLDQALCYLYAVHRRNNLPTRVYWMLHMDVLQIWLDGQVAPWPRAP